MRSCGLLTLNYIKMTIEEAEEKLSNMHFDSIVKSYCNKVNDIKRLKAEIKQLNEQLRIHDVVGRSEQFKCHSCGTNHSGKNDDQLFEICKTCFDGI